MSNEALTAVSKANIRPSGRKFVMMALADYADEQWSCFPSVAQLAAYTSQGEKTVRDHLDALEKQGCITRVRTRKENGELGRYRFVVQRRNLPVANLASGEKQPSPAAKSAGRIPQGNPHKSSSLRSDDKRSPRDELEAVLDPERAAAVIEHRRKIRKPLTAHAARILARKFACCPDPNGAADTMIGNGWQGFDPSWLSRRDNATAPAGNDMDAIISGKSNEPEQAYPNTIDASFERRDRRGPEGSVQRPAFPARD
jgi:hypothetical protein